MQTLMGAQEYNSFYGLFTFIENKVFKMTYLASNSLTCDEVYKKQNALGKNWKGRERFMSQ